jgi:SAM-dependent methyltransferase
MIMSRWKLRLNRFMRVKPICYVVFYVRFFYFMHIRHALRSHDGNLGVAERGHNEVGITHGRPSDRILKLILPLSVLDSMGPDSKVLAIGCRYETDLLYLAAYGFTSKNIRGFDLFSYSPWVDLGNMHAIQYEDNSWDAILCGWTITYSNQPELAAREMVRILRPGGVVAISISYYPTGADSHIATGDMAFGSVRENRSADAMLKLFGRHVDVVYFKHDPADKSKTGSCLAVFSIKK